MPYGIRFISRELLNGLQRKFPVINVEDEERIVRVIGASVADIFNSFRRQFCVLSLHEPGHCGT